MGKKRIKVCPNCESSEIILWMGGLFGILYKCKNCGYVGPLIVEKDLDEGQFPDV